MPGATTKYALPYPIGSESAGNGDLSIKSLAEAIDTKMALAAYPIGAVYISVLTTSPATLFGGTWVAIATGRTLVGVDTAQSEFISVELAGGTKTATMPAHNHGESLASHAHSGSAGGGGHEHNYSIRAGSEARGTGNLTVSQFTQVGAVTTGGGAHSHTLTVDAGNATHTHTTEGSGNNLPPYLTVYIWKRTA